jgi:hypothetical protein
MISLMVCVAFYMVFLATSFAIFMLDHSKWVGLISAIVHPFVALPLALFVFHKGFYGIVMGRGHFNHYKIGETLIITIGLIKRIFRIFLLSIQLPWTFIHNI